MVQLFENSPILRGSLRYKSVSPLFQNQIIQQFPLKYLHDFLLSFLSIAEKNTFKVVFFQARSKISGAVKSRWKAATLWRHGGGVDSGWAVVPQVNLSEFLHTCTIRSGPCPGFTQNTISGKQRCSTISACFYFEIPTLISKPIKLN